MVRSRLLWVQTPIHSPRIRGDGPAGRADVANIEPFSPYSRGWSQAPRHFGGSLHILPVFAGMVRGYVHVAAPLIYSPRIRGDGPMAQPGSLMGE